MAYYNGPRRKKKVDPSTVRRRTTQDDFENILGKLKKEDINVDPYSQFRTINGIPHKYKDGVWVPLTKI